MLRCRRSRSTTIPVGPLLSSNHCSEPIFALVDELVDGRWASNPTPKNQLPDNGMKIVIDAEGSKEIQCGQAWIEEFSRHNRYKNANSRTWTYCWRRFRYVQILTSTALRFRRILSIIVELFYTVYSHCIYILDWNPLSYLASLTGDVCDSKLNLGVLTWKKCDFIRPLKCTLIRTCSLPSVRMKKSVVIPTAKYSSGTRPFTRAISK